MSDTMKDPIIPTVEAIEDLQRCIDYWGRRTEKAEASNKWLRTALEKIRWIEGINPSAYKIAVEALRHEQEAGEKK